MPDGTGLVPLSGFSHYGIVVLDLDRALDELGSTMGLEWASVQRREFPMRQPNGVVDADFRFTYSVTGPPHFEIIQACPGTIWDPANADGVHHLGYWSEDLAADAAALTDAGFVWEGTYEAPDFPFGFTYHTLPSARLRVELVDRSRQPAFDAWLAGSDFPSALEEAGVD